MHDGYFFFPDSEDEHPAAVGKYQGMTETQVDNIRLEAEREALITELTRWVTGAGYPAAFARERAAYLTEQAANEVMRQLEPRT